MWRRKGGARRGGGGRRLERQVERELLALVALELVARLVGQRACRARTLALACGRPTRRSERRLALPALALLPCALDLLLDELALPHLVVDVAALLLLVRLCAGERPRRRVDPRDPPALLVLVDVRDARAAEVLGELGEREEALRAWARSGQPGPNGRGPPRWQEGKRDVRSSSCGGGAGRRCTPGRPG